MKKLIPLLFVLIACSSKQISAPETKAQTANEPVQIAAVDTNKVLNKITFGSCQHQKFPQPIWNALMNTSPDLYISMGDTIYASRPEDQPLSAQYVIQAQVPEFKKMRAQIPMVATWDDHDAGENDGGADNPELPEAKSEFVKFFPYDAQVIPADRKGVYHSFIFGGDHQRVQVLLLDLRTYRSPLEKNPHPKSRLDIYQPTHDLKKTMLGEEQWQWLEGELKKPADVRILVSSIQFVAEDHGFEKWANFPHERKRLLNLLRQTKARNVVIFSGDRHMSEISHMNWPGVGEIYDFTSSGINRVATIQDEKNRHRVGGIYAHENFGLAEIDWKKRNMKVSIHDIKGDQVQEVSLKLK